MEEVNKFYKTYKKEEDKNEYDLRVIDTDVLRFVDIAFVYTNGHIEGGKSHSSPANADDYDDAFFKFLLKIKPVYRIENCLDYHYENYINEKSGDNGLFIKHMEYVILPRFKHARYIEQTEIIKEWVNKNKTTMIKKLMKDKNDFLIMACETALKESKGNPYGLNINPFVLGKLVGLDEADTKRVMIELVNDGFVSSSLGVKSLFVTPEGMSYCAQLENSNQKSDSPNINLNVGNHSTVQFQQGTVNSSQSVQTNRDVLNAVEKIIEAIKRDNSIDNKKQIEILECLGEIQEGINANKKPKFAIKSLIDIAGGISSIASWVTMLGQYAGIIPPLPAL